MDDVVVEGGWAIIVEGGCVNGVEISSGVVPDEAAPGRGDSRSVLDWGGCDVGGALLLGGSDDGLSWSPSKSASRAGFLNQSGGTGKFDPAGVAGSEGACAGCLMAGSASMSIGLSQCLFLRSCTCPDLTMYSRWLAPNPMTKPVRSHFLVIGF